MSIINKFSVFSFTNKEQDLKLLEGNSQIGIKDVFQLILGISLLSLAIVYFHIEQDLQLPILMPIIGVGFVLHALMPLAYRQGFFFLLNIIAIFWLFSWQAGITVLTLGVGLVVIASLPIKVLYRAIIILAISILLALARIGWLPFENATQVSMILGALFMFRMILYLYEMQHEKSNYSFWKRLNYFFLLPNWVFFIFPVVDYKTFVRNYYDVPAAENYRKGLQWMIRGFLHLLFYRIIYYYLLPDPTKIGDIYSLIQYLIASYALIVRLSGIFHFSAGVLCLFGYNLPETFNNYFLASGFSDLWRRINIYWKDFVMKVFYFPIYFSFKRKNNSTVFTTVMIIFAINWFLHAYQWFWIRGTFLIKWTDVIFWVVFGVLVGINSVYQRNKKKNNEIHEGFNRKMAIIKTIQIMSMFLFMCILWSFWTSDTIENWLNLYRQINVPSFNQLLIIFSTLTGIGILGFCAFYLEYKKPTYFSSLSKSNVKQLWVMIFFMALFVGLGNPIINPQLGKRLGFDFEPIMVTKLNEFDEEQLFKGYYEDLIVGNNFSSRMWEVQQEKDEELTRRDKPDNWGKMHKTGIVEKEGDFINKRLLPNEEILFKDKVFTTNQYGMRDRNYTLKKDEGTLRMAMLGGSIEMGSGVKDDETFENQLEDQLNIKSIWPSFKNIEILNFAISGIHYCKQIGIAEERVKPFHPDVLFYPFHMKEELRSLKTFAELLKSPVALKSYPELVEFSTLANITPETSVEECIRRLEPLKKDLFRWSMKTMAKFCKEQDIIPVWIYVLTIGNRTLHNEFAILSAIAKEEGFFILNLGNAYDGYNREDLKAAKWDNHPNALGHQLIAKTMYEAMNNNEALNKAINSKK